MPTLAANLISDSVGKGGDGSGRVAGYGMLEGQPGRKVRRQKKKSLVIGKGGPGSGPKPGGGKVYDKAAKVARSAERTANASRTPENHQKAAAAHRDAAKVATGIMVGVHERSAAVHDYLASH